MTSLLPSLSLPPPLSPLFSLSSVLSLPSPFCPPYLLFSLSPQAFSSLAEAAYEATDAAEEQEEPATYCLSSSFEIIVQTLLEPTDR